jgi:hypothetical protein
MLRRDRCCGGGSLPKGQNRVCSTFLKQACQIIKIENGMKDGRESGLMSRLTWTSGVGQGACDLVDEAEAREQGGVPES